MEKYLNCTTDALSVFQRLEIEIAKVQQVLQYLKDEGTQRNHKINDRVKRYLKEHLNILYQAQAFLLFAVVEQYLTILKHLQVILKSYAGRIHTPVEMRLLKHGAILPAFWLLVGKKGTYNDMVVQKWLPCYVMVHFWLCQRIH